MPSDKMIKQFRPVELSAKMVQSWSDAPEARYAAGIQFSTAEEDNNALLIKINVSFIEYFSKKDIDSSKEPTVTVECIYLVEQTNPDTDKSELVSDFWPFIRCGILVQTNLLGKDFSRWLPISIDAESIQKN